MNLTMNNYEQENKRKKFLSHHCKEVPCDANMNRKPLNDSVNMTSQKINKIITLWVSRLMTTHNYKNWKLPRD